MNPILGEVLRRQFSPSLTHKQLRVLLLEAVKERGSIGASYEYQPIIGPSNDRRYYVLCYQGAQLFSNRPELLRLGIESPKLKEAISEFRDDKHQTDEDLEWLQRLAQRQIP